MIYRKEKIVLGPLIVLAGQHSRFSAVTLRVSVDELLLIDVAVNEEIVFVAVTMKNILSFVK